MDNIIELCKDHYLVNGTIIWAVDGGMFQGDERSDLLLAVKSATGKFATRAYGALTVHGYSYNRDPNRPDVKYAATGLKHAAALPDEAKEILRKEMPDHAGEI